MSLQSKLIVKNKFLSHQCRGPPMNFGSFLVLATCRELTENHLLRFPQHVYCFEEHKLPLWWTMFWSSGRILSHEKAINEITIEVDLLKWCTAWIVPQISSASAINNPNFCKGIAVGALKLWSIFAEFEDLCLVHVFQQLLRCFTEPVDLLRPETNGTQASWSTWRLFVVFVRPALELLREICMEFWNSVVHNVASGLPEALCSQDDLASWLGRSCDSHCEFALSTTRGLSLSLW